MILTWANIGAGHYTQWCSMIILLSILCVVSLRKTDLSNIKMNVPFPKEYTDQITSNWSRCSVQMLLVIQSVTGGYGNIWSAWTNFVSDEESAETRYEMFQALPIFSYPPCNWLYNEFIPAMKFSSIHSLALCKLLTNVSVPVAGLELFFFFFFNGWALMFQSELTLW
jgi:hypothetical protein